MNKKIASEIIAVLNEDINDLIKKQDKIAYKINKKRTLIEKLFKILEPSKMEPTSNETTTTITAEEMIANKPQEQSGKPSNVGKPQEQFGKPSKITTQHFQKK